MNAFKKASLIFDAYFAGLAGNVLFERRGFACNHGFSAEICIVGIEHEKAQGLNSIFRPLNPLSPRLMHFDEDDTE